MTHWSTYNLPFVYANLAVETPVSGTSNTIRVRIDGQDHDLLFIGGDTSQPPMVQTYTTNSPKAAKPVTKQHVWAYENNGNLVIKWDEPADLIDPYWQVRVFIGNKYSNATPSPIPTSGVTYATLEVPPQAGMAVMPTGSWTKMKDALRPTTNKVYISVYYRRVYQNTTTGRNEMMQVRSQSDGLEYQFE